MSDRKRQKTTNNKILNTSSITKFEQLPNELILICFAYFNFYELYEIFSGLKQRFNQLIQNESNIHINLASIPSEKFLTFCFQLNQCKNYPLSIIAYGKHKLNLILEDDLFQEKFSKLKSLSLSKMNVGTIDRLIFNETTKLYQSLERLSLLDKIREDREGSFNIDRLFKNLISSKMKSLKYLKLNYFHALEKREKPLSHLETIIIGNISDNYNTKARANIFFYTLIEDLLPCLPKLKNLIINSICFEDFFQRQRHKLSSTTTTTTNSILPLNLKILPSIIEINPNIPLNLKLIKI
ncbi:unnamed protein product [Rotaria sordida]|uniref:F-box domain-containing protein n=1 Tax=Rotaria sordida TaxID=392033 RepID=A0A816CY71_9BILA|nr:unnamed protein product [Rotaria sordida]CAF1627680.1 unnamed protein product [Rotaria sordida]